MARRNDHTRDEIRSMAIKAGRKLIQDQGFVNFSARKVASQIGYTIGTIYNVFEGYDDLILHINSETLKSIRHYFEDNMPPHSTGIKAVKLLCSFYVEFVFKNYSLWKVLFEYSLRSQSELPAWYLEEVHRIFEFAERYLRPVLNNDQKLSHLASAVLWAGIHGICSLESTAKLSYMGVSSVQLLTDSLVDNYLSGLLMEQRLLKD